jgi:uncharacterized protein
MSQVSARDVVARTEQVVREKLGDESTGHDWWHADRVRTTAVRIATADDADVFIVELAALLHDVDDYKFSGDAEAGPTFARNHLLSVGADAAVADEVADIIRQMSFKGANVQQPELSLEGQCVQDADWLDALGAIGIARTFAYGGFVRRPMHDPDVLPVLHTSVDAYVSSRGTTVNHFHEKLFLLRTRMNTDFGKQLAEERHRFMEGFLQHFHAEWQGAH